MPDRDNEPKTRQERKSKGKFNKKNTDVKYNSKRVRSYEHMIFQHSEKVNSKT